MKDIEVVAAPSILGLISSGVDKLPDALMKEGLVEKLRANYYGTLETPPYNSTRDPEINVLNAKGIREFSLTLADTMQPMITETKFPLVLGGDCSIILGIMLGLKRSGKYGLLFLDGHADFYQPSASSTGEAADMDLALATGRGPDILTDIENRKPLVQDNDVVAFGYRDVEEARLEGSQDITKTSIATFDLQEIRRLGAEKAIEKALGTLTRDDLNGFWLHMDADVLDDQIMPAVDYRIPDGLSFEELITVVSQSLTAKGCVGMSITIFNPSLDVDGTIAKNLTDAVAASFAKAGYV